LFLTLARTGLRLGEALGLQWGDIDFKGGFIEVRRAWVNQQVTTTKSGKTRRVDATPQLLTTLLALGSGVKSRR
jgi:integrase